MKTTRRDLFKFAGGTAVGAVFTPVPWRLVTDAALWSENWPGIPRPARGEVRARFTNCTLCPAGCAVRARCIGAQPVALGGVPADPAGRGALCPFGLTGHHLPYHPARLKQGPVKEAAAAVAAAIAKCGATERVAVLDLRPGRTASWTYRRAMEGARGVYLAPPEPKAAFYPGAAKMVLSLGAPLLDGWGTPGNAMAAREQFRLIQADPIESSTAALADQWLPIQPGSEEALALGLAEVLKPGAGIQPAEAARITGLSEQQIVSLAKELTGNGPALVVDREGSSTALALNVMLGGWGRTVAARREAPVPAAWKHAAPVAELASVPDESIRVLLIDESAPGDYLAWHAIEKKLVRENPLVVVFGWSRMGYGRHAQYVLPTAVYPEAIDDVAPAIDAATATFRISTPLVAPPAGMVSPSEFIAAAVGMAAGDALKERAEAIHKNGRGTLVTYFDGKSTAVKDTKPDDFWKGLNQGGCWLDTEGNKTPAPAIALGRTKQLDGSAAAAEWPLVAVLAERHGSAAPVSPLMSKVYQESNLRLVPGRVALHPDAAARSGVKDGARAVLETEAGKWAIEVTVDAGVPPGVVAVTARPEILDMCADGARARVVRA